MWLRHEVVLNPAGVSAFHFVTIGVVGITTAVSIWTHPDLIPLTPRPDELVDDAWTGGFAAIIGIALLKIFRAAPLETRDKASIAKKDIGQKLWDYAADEARASGCDPELIQAIIAAEAIQRPRWLRSMEGWVGKFRVGKGTYGVAQITSRYPMTDKESIAALCQRFSGFIPAKPLYGADRARFEARLEEDHNSSSAFIEDVVHLYNEFIGYSLRSSQSKRQDGRPTIELRSVRRVGQHVHFEGTCVADADGLVLISEEPHMVKTAKLQLTKPHRTPWEFHLPLSTHEAHLIAVNGGFTEDFEVHQIEAYLLLSIDDLLH